MNLHPLSYSVNNVLVVESYKGDRVKKSTVSNGFAFMEQKVSVKPVKLLVNAKITIGNEVIELPRGTLIHLKEEFLLADPIAQKLYKSPGIEEDFLLVPFHHVQLIEQV